MNLKIENGVLSGASQRPSPNFGARPADCSIDLVVVHSISLPPGEYGGDAIERFFCNALPADEHPYFAQVHAMKVSAHLLIKRSGEIVQFVNFDERAWHAGRSSFAGRSECNDYSIGVELEGSDVDVFEEPQYRALAAVLSAIEVAYPQVSTERIVGHSDVAPGRKTDPGTGFDWQRLRDERVRQDKS